MRQDKCIFSPTLADKKGYIQSQTKNVALILSFASKQTVLDSELLSLHPFMVAQFVQCTALRAALDILWLVLLALCRTQPVELQADALTGMYAGLGPVGVFLGSTGQF